MDKKDLIEILKVFEKDTRLLKSKLRDANDEINDEIGSDDFNIYLEQFIEIDKLVSTLRTLIFEDNFFTAIRHLDKLAEQIEYVSGIIRAHTLDWDEEDVLLKRAVETAITNVERSFSKIDKELRNLV